MLELTAEKKSQLSRFGKIEIDNQNTWSEGANGFSATPYMQSLILLAGQGDNYKSAELYITNFLRIAVDDSQLNRICQTYGTMLESENIDLEGDLSVAGEKMYSELKADEDVYAMMDGCMLPTRDKGGSWQEMKLGRVFSTKSHFKADKKRNFIQRSLFVSHFGAHESFTNKFENVVDKFDKLGKRLVFINDGASWINTWIKENYPKATNILDYFHASEYLHDFAKAAMVENRQEWVEKQTSLLFDDEVELVISEIEGLSLKGKIKEDARNKILTYYKNNKDRMKYKTYKDRGLLIGSGPIESAHRFVLQKRMKQSGQMWTKTGGQAIANIRIAYLNQRWAKVIALINKPKKAA